MKLTRALSLLALPALLLTLAAPASADPFGDRNGGRPGWGGGGSPGWQPERPGHGGPGHGGPGFPGGPGGPGGPGWGQPPQAQWLPVHRFFHRNHFQTLDYNEGVRARMAYEGVSFYVLSQQLPGTTPLFRCLVPGTMDHFISNDRHCEGQMREGVYGFVYQQPSRYAPKAVYRCYGRGDHLSTTNPQECSIAGYQVEMVQGYTP